MWEPIAARKLRRNYDHFKVEPDCRKGGRQRLSQIKPFGTSTPHWFGCAGSTSVPNSKHRPLI